MPVVSISVRVWIGIQKMLLIPGVRRVEFISASSFSHVIPARHSDNGLNETIVSNIESGAGSVAVSACPAFPKTVWTSGNFFNCRSWICRILVASSIAIPGTAVGM